MWPPLAGRDPVLKIINAKAANKADEAKRHAALSVNEDI